MELTGRGADAAVVALHDCDQDPNRAINMLLEGEDHQVSSKLTCCFYQICFYPEYKSIT